MAGQMAGCLSWLGMVSELFEGLGSMVLPLPVNNDHLASYQQCVNAEDQPFSS